jgi:class 3 adenylate cyclase
LRNQKQIVSITNHYEVEQLVRVERTAARKDVITAAEAVRLPLLRSLFPDQTLPVDQMWQSQRIALLVTEIANANEIYARLDDAETLQLFRAFQQWLDQQVVQHRGMIVKGVGDGIVTAFNDGLDAVNAAFHIHESIRNEAHLAHLTLNVAVHCGTAIVTNVDNHLDFFGNVTRVAIELPGFGDGEVVLSPSVLADPVISQRLESLTYTSRRRAVNLVGQCGQMIECFRLASDGPADLARVDEAVADS